jgi:hypothetical protein
MKTSEIGAEREKLVIEKINQENFHYLVQQHREEKKVFN